jgi:protein-S-isoprenylcysteine O-methyltransferase Ste14
MAEREVPSPIPWPPIIFVTLLGAGSLLTWLARVPFLPGTEGWLWGGLGAVIAVAAVAIVVAAFIALRRAATTVRVDRAPTRLVETGIFRYSRNPMYLAMALVLLGLAIGSNSLWFLLAVPVFLVAVHILAIAPEEEFLEHRFGDAYAAYKRRVARWFGWRRL